MKNPISFRTIGTLLLAGCTMLTFSQLHAAESGAMPMNRAVTADLKTIHGKGVVRSIDTAANTVTLAHDPIPEISWPAMTMAFKVSGDAEEQLKVGESVEFEMKNEGEAYTITRIEKAR